MLASNAKSECCVAFRSSKAIDNHLRVGGQWSPTCVLPSILKIEHFIPLAEILRSSTPQFVTRNTLCSFFLIAPLALGAGPVQRYCIPYARIRGTSKLCLMIGIVSVGLTENSLSLDIFSCRAINCFIINQMLTRYLSFIYHFGLFELREISNRPISSLYPVRLLRTRQTRNRQLKHPKNKIDSELNQNANDQVREITSCTAANDNETLPTRPTTARTPGLGAQKHFSCAFVYGPGAGCVMQTDSMTEKRVALVLLARADVISLENQVLFPWYDKGGKQCLHFFDFRAVMADGRWQPCRNYGEVSQEA